MEKLEFKLDESTELNFSVVIEGSQSNTLKANLIIENETFNISLPCKNIKNDLVNIIIPPLKNIMKEGKYNGRLEMIVEDRYFDIMDFELNAVNPVKVTFTGLTESKTSPAKEKNKKPSVKLLNKPPLLSEKAKSKAEVEILNEIKSMTQEDKKVFFTLLNAMIKSEIKKK